MSGRRPVCDRSLCSTLFSACLALSCKINGDWCHCLALVSGLTFIIIAPHDLSYSDEAMMWQRTACLLQAVDDIDGYASDVFVGFAPVETVPAST